MLDEHEIIHTLDRVDWNFPGASTPRGTIHSIHRFPGNFIPQIPAYLVQLLSEPGHLVFDPFCGSGTTGVEAIQLDRRVWLSDVNRASIQVTRGKLTSIMNPRISKEIQNLLNNLIWEDILRSDQFGCNSEGSNPALGVWFHEDTLAQLRYIWNLIESASSDALRSLLEVLFSDTLFACASPSSAVTSTGKRRRHHWGWVADNVRPEKPIWQNAIKLFRERVSHAADVLQRIDTTYHGSVIIRREDARTLSVPDSTVDLIITSPPYLGMIDYALANRFTYLWMGWSLQEDQEAEIGARFRRKKHRVMEEYLEAMSVASQRIVRALRPGHYCAIVIGASRRYPEVAMSVIELFGHQLDILWGPKGRIPTRRRVSDRQGREPVELICIFRKPTSS